MQTTKGKLRNITTGIMHTTIGDVYEFIEEYIGEKGIMTHHLPSACRALKPILQTKLPDEWFTDEWVKDGLDEIVDVPDMTDDEKKTFWESFNELNGKMWENLKDKTIIVKAD